MSWKDAKIVGANVDPEAYHRENVPRGTPDFCMSRGALMAFLACPSKWVAGGDEEDEQTEATQWGNLMDCMILTPKEFEKRYIVVEPEYLNVAGGWKPKQQDQWRKDHPGAEPIKEKKLAEPKRALARFKLDERAVSLVECSRAQVMVIATWVEGDIEVPCKALIDIAPADDAPEMFRTALADLKTGRSAGLGAWRKEVFNRNYHVQAAFYLDLWNAATSQKRDSWLHIIQENVPPYEVGRRFLSVEWIKWGRATYQAALKLYTDCLRDSKWPSYDDLAKTSIEGWSVCEPEPWMVMQASDTPGISMSDEL